MAESTGITGKYGSRDAMGRMLLAIIASEEKFGEQVKQLIRAGIDPGYVPLNDKGAPLTSPYGLLITQIYNYEHYPEKQRASIRMLTQLLRETHKPIPRERRSWNVSNYKDPNSSWEDPRLSPEALHDWLRLKKTIKVIDAYNTIRQLPAQCTEEKLSWLAQDGKIYPPGKEERSVLDLTNRKANFEQALWILRCDAPMLYREILSDPNLWADRACAAQWAARTEAKYCYIEETSKRHQSEIAQGMRRSFLPLEYNHPGPTWLNRMAEREAKEAALGGYVAPEKGR